MSKTTWIIIAVIVVLGIVFYIGTQFEKAQTSGTAPQQQTFWDYFWHFLFKGVRN